MFLITIYHSCTVLNLILIILSIIYCKQKWMYMHRYYIYGIYTYFYVFLMFKKHCFITRTLTTKTVIMIIDVYINTRKRYSVGLVDFAARGIVAR